MTWRSRLRRSPVGLGQGAFSMTNFRLTTAPRPQTLRDRDRSFDLLGATLPVHYMNKITIALASCSVFSLLGSAMAVTTWTGAVDNDINNAGNWDNGLPTNDGSNDGIVPDGAGQLAGSPQNKNLTFQGRAVVRPRRDTAPGARGGTRTKTRTR